MILKETEIHLAGEKRARTKLQNCYRRFLRKLYFQNGLLKVRERIELLRKTVSGTVLMLLLTSMLSSTLIIQPVKAESTTIVVPDDYPSIQEAINAANMGDMILVRAGTYTENVNVNKTLTIKSENGADVTIVQAADPYNHVFSVTANYVNLSGFTVTGTKAPPYWKAGIMVTGNYCNITDINVRYCDTGIILSGQSSNNTIVNNFISNTRAGIYVWYSNDNKIINNNVSGNSDGVGLDNANNNLIVNNIVNSNQRGMTFWYSSNNIVTTTTLSYGGVGIWDYTGGGNNFSQNAINFNQGAGIRVGWRPGEWTGGQSIKGNNISNNYYGIYLANVMSAVVSNNLIDSNQYGVFLQGIYEIYLGGVYMDWKSLYNTIKENRVTNNNHGLYLGNLTAENAIYHNNFVNNIDQAYDNGTGNLFDDGYPSGGNYWSDYTDVDLYSGLYQNETGSDGIWDHPYVIDTNNTDRYPLVNPWTPTPTYVQGIDVSHWQGDINWSEVYGAGYRFAFVKASEGVGWIDPNFTTNMESGRNAGLLMGAYHFARPDLGNDAQDEALYFVSVARNYLKSGYLRPVLDLEVGSSLGKEALSNWVHEWMETVKNETGIEPIIYVNSNYANNYLDNSVAKYNLWIAHWTYDTNMTTNTGIWSSWDFWQYSNNGSVLGISGDVDLDLFNGDIRRLYDAFVIPENQPPVALFDYYPVEPKAGEQVTFNASSSYDPDGTIVCYEWDWNGDGYFEDFSESPIQNFWWIESGDYHVHLRVVDNRGDAANTTIDITVAESTSDRVNVILAAWYDWIAHPLLYWKHHDAFTKIDEWLRDNDLDGQAELQPLAWLKGTGLEGKIDEADVMMIFDEEINPEVAPGLTYKAFALSKINEEELVHLALMEQTPKYWIIGAPLFKYALSTAWSLGISITVDEIAALEPLVGVGLQTILLGSKTVSISETFSEIDKQLFILALGSYFRERINRPNDPVESAWEGSNARILINAAITPKTEQEREEILEATKEYFEALWQEYKEHAREPDLYGLSEEFRRDNKEILKQLLIQALKEKYTGQLLSRKIAHMASPVELRVYDSEGSVTGVINGEVREEIPYSVYDDETKTIKIFNPTDSYNYMIIGTSVGTYELEITSIENGQIINFTATDIPTSTTSIHQFIINWTALSQGEEGVMVQVDSDGDGVFEHTFTSDSELTQSEFLSHVAPPLSVSISPLSASILVGQSVTFTSTVSGGATPYSYQWYLNDNPVSGATSDTWAFTPATSGIYYVYLKVTDDTGNTTQSETARITVATVPVGGYSYSINKYTLLTPIATHIALIAILTAIFITIKRKTKRKH